MSIYSPEDWIKIRRGQIPGLTPPPPAPGLIGSIGEFAYRNIPGGKYIGDSIYSGVSEALDREESKLPQPTHSLKSKFYDTILNLKRFVDAPGFGTWLKTIASNPALEVISRPFGAVQEIAAKPQEQGIFTSKLGDIGQRVLPEVFGELQRETPQMLESMQTAYPSLKSHPYISALIASILDIVADPSNFIPIGAGAKAVKPAIAKELAGKYKVAVPVIDDMLAKAQKIIAKPMVGEGANLKSGMARIRKAIPELKVPEPPIPEVAKELDINIINKRGVEKHQVLVNGLILEEGKTYPQATKIMGDIKIANGELQMTSGQVGKLSDEGKLAYTGFIDKYKRIPSAEELGEFKDGRFQVIENRIKKYGDLSREQVPPAPTIAPKGVETPSTIGKIDEIRQAETIIPPKPSITATEPTYQFGRVKYTESQLKSLQDKVASGETINPRQYAALKQWEKNVLPPSKPPAPPVLPSPIEPTAPKGATRGFVETAITSKETTPEAKAVLQGLPQTRDVLTNAEALSKADEVIARLGPEEASKQVLDLSVPFSGEKSALGIRLIRKYENDKNWEKMTELVNSLSDQMTKGGQGNQVAKLMSMMSPEGFLRYANKIGEKVGRPLSDSVQQAILKKMSEITAMPHGEARQKAMTELLNFTADNMPLTFGEKFESYRYQNMLSGLRTQYRNIFSNTFNTFITRPADLFASSVYDFAKHPFNPLARNAKLMDAPAYYKQVLKSIPDSLVAFKESFKRFGKMEKYDLLSSGGESTIENLRRAKTPGSLTVVPRFMEATDKFFSTMIGTGEKARLMRAGMGEAEATAKATKMAEHYLYRERLGVQSQDKAYMVRALDAVSDLLLKGRKVPFIGKPFAWATPFITTPTNVAKMAVEHSPLGFLGGKKFYTSPERATQLTKAISGSLVTAAGAYYAMEGKTTWEAPTDPTSKALFYASGKKPYSVNINGVWVPMWYFGPYAVSLAVPAAVQYYEDDSKTALSDSQVDKLGKISGGLTKFIAAQTPLQGVSSFFRILEGDIDFSISNMLGFTAGQVIPAEGLIRYVNTIIDPVYRKARGVKETIMKDLPGLSTKLPYYTEPTGEPSKRTNTRILGIPANYYLPYDVGVANPEYADILKDREAMLQLRALANAMKKEAQLDAMTQPAQVTPTQVSPEEWLKQKRKNYTPEEWLKIRRGQAK